MKRTFHLLGQAVPLVLLWAAIVEIGFRMQQSFGPLVAPLRHAEPYNECHLEGKAEVTRTLLERRF
jgi:hypothetical protein